MIETLNPPCLKCQNEPNYRGGDVCKCNDEERCAQCNHCSWCIDERLNGVCRQNINVNPDRCVNMRSIENRDHMHRRELWIIIGCTIAGIILLILLLLLFLRRKKD